MILVKFGVICRNLLGGTLFLQPTHQQVFFLELLTKSVFFGQYRSVFLGIYHTDTDGKLGQYISVSKRRQLPPFFLKRGLMAPFLRSIAPFRGKKGGTIQKGGNNTKKGGTIPTENTNTEPI